jgi:glycosyltransferase involved in cell wall biosynthesis
MKILVVTQYFWPESFRINDLVKAWTDLGHEVTVLAGLPNYPAGRFFDGYSWTGPYREFYAGARVYRVPIVSRGARRGWRLIVNYLSFVFAGVVLGPLRVRGSFDVIFAYAPSPITIAVPGIWFKTLRRIPMALWIQDLWPDNLAALGAVKSPTVLRAVSAMSAWIYRRCNLLLLQSPAFEGPVKLVCPEAANFRVLPNWADDFYRPERLDRDVPERREFPDGFTVVFAGNLGSAQGLDAVLDAADVLRADDVHWVFIGDGNQRASLEAETKRRGLATHVRFLGWRPGESMPRYLNLADALLVSLRRDRSFASTIPAKLQSSLAVGRPILAALEGEGARIVAEAKAGVVVAPESAEALVAGVRRLLAAGAEGRAAMGRNGSAYAATHFERNRLVAQLDGWLREMAEAGA